MLFWPAVSVVGFLLLAAVVVALATSSTARYDFQRNQVQRQRQQLAVPATVGTGTAEAGAVTVSGAKGFGATGFGAVAIDAAVPGRHEQAAAVEREHHPADVRVAEFGAPAWWLVKESADGAAEQVMAGPFDDRIDADWAALATGLVSGPAAAVRVVHGVLRPDGRLVRRGLPAERAWLAELGEQLDRLPEEWDSPLAEEEELVTLVVEVAAALVESGLPLHDCDGYAPAGGVCLTPAVGRQGVLVSWHPHDRMGRDQVRGAATHVAVQQTMNTAIADCLHQLGFDFELFEATGCSLVAVRYPAG